MRLALGLRCLRQRIANVGLPTNSIAPAVTGTAQVNGTLTGDNGTWTNAYTYARAWYSNTTNSTTGRTLLVGDTDSTLFLDDTLSGLYIFEGVIATNVLGQASSEVFSNIAGPVAAASGLTAPTLTLTSATGASPEWDTAIGSDIYAGYFLRIQASADGIENGDGSGYTTPTKDVTHQINDGDVALGADGKGQISHAELVADGWTSVTGTWHIHARIEREDGTVSSWSSPDLTGTISGSVAEFATTTGADKSGNIQISNANLTGTMVSVNNNTMNGVRVEPAPGTGKWHIEFNIDSLANGSSGESGNVAFGVCGESENFSTTHTLPGNGTSGASCVVRWDNAHLLIYANGGLAQNVTTAATPVVNDKIIMEFDPTANTVTFWHWRAATSIATQIGTTTTLTTSLPTNPWHAFAGGYRMGPPADGFTINAGGSSFAMTPTTGYAGW